MSWGECGMKDTVCGRSRGGDEHCTTKQGHSEGHHSHWQILLYTFCMRSHTLLQKHKQTTPTKFPLLTWDEEEEEEEEEESLLLFTDRLPFLDLEKQTDRSRCCLLFHALCSVSSAGTLPAARLHVAPGERSRHFLSARVVKCVSDAGSFVFLVVKFPFKENLSGVCWVTDTNCLWSLRGKWTDLFNQISTNRHLKLISDWLLVKCILGLVVLCLQVSCSFDFKSMKQTFCNNFISRSESHHLHTKIHCSKILAKSTENIKIIVELCFFCFVFVGN